jgi:multicomponent Na+:H+ antiporter subunit B
MSRAWRVRLFVAGGAVLLALLCLAGARLPLTGEGRSPLGDLIASVAVGERNTTDVVTAINFDYRGFDTLGEEHILYVSVLGVTLLLRDEKRKRKRQSEIDGSTEASGPLPTSAAIRMLAHGLVSVSIVFGIYLVMHGAQTPGGGFQGGVILSTAPLLAYLAVGPSMLPQIAPERLLEIGEAAASLGYICVGTLGLLAGGAFLQNVLPLGQVGKLWAAGTIPALNLVSGLAVSTGMLVLLSVFLEKAREEDPGG